MDGKDGKMVWNPVSKRSMILVTTVLVVVIGSVTWGFRQTRLLQAMHARALTAEQAVIQAQAVTEQARESGKVKSFPLRDQAIARAARRGPKDDDRVRQLSEEVEALNRIQDRIHDDLQAVRSRMARLAGPAKKAEPRRQSNDEPGPISP